MEEETTSDPRIREILNTLPEEAGTRPLTRVAVVRARQRVGQRDTLTFMFVRLWAALARVLAPFFAMFGEKQAVAMRSFRTTASSTSDRDRNK